jgi:hypothetical protein
MSQQWFRPQVAEANRKTAEVRKRYLTAFNKTILIGKTYFVYSNVSRLENDDSCLIKLQGYLDFF